MLPVRAKGHWRPGWGSYQFARAGQRALAPRRGSYHFARTGKIGRPLAPVLADWCQHTAPIIRRTIYPDVHLCDPHVPLR